MKTTILIPSFNDWESTSQLISEISTLDLSPTPKITVINDASVQSSNLLPSEQLTTINLNQNLGHQRAIAVGLCYLNEYDDSDLVIVMDGDGEDSPSDIHTLINTHKEQQCIVFAKRNKRYVYPSFKIFYYIYKILFSSLTNHTLNFGNFCAIGRTDISKVTKLSHLWNHFAAAIVRSKIKYNSVPIDRAKRYCGKSKMNFTSLLIHGISSIAVFIDIVAARILMFSTLGIILCLLTYCISYFEIIESSSLVEFFSLGLIFVFSQLFILGGFILLMILFFRTLQTIIPQNVYKSYIHTVDKNNERLPL